jgi:hypothetical protein
MSPAGARLSRAQRAPFFSFLVPNQAETYVQIPDAQPAQNLLPAVESCAMLDIAKARKQLAARKKSFSNKAEELLMLGKWVEADEVLSEYERMRAEQPYMKQDKLVPPV